MNSIPENPNDLPEVKILSYKNDPLLAHLSATRDGWHVRNHTRWIDGYLWCNITIEYAERMIRRFLSLYYTRTTPECICAILAQHFSHAAIQIHDKSAVITVSWYSRVHTYLAPQHLTVTIILKDGD